jgi:TolB protein
VKTLTRIPRPRRRFALTSIAVVAFVAGGAAPAIAQFGHGNQLLFTRTHPGKHNIASIDTSTKKVHLLSSDGVTANGEFSPSGKRMVFASNRNADVDGELWVASASGSNAHAITSDSVSESQPVWTPNGKQIVFKMGGPSPGYYKINPDGSGEAPIYTFPGGDFGFEPVVSPDGSHIAFSMNVGDANAADVYTLAMNGTGLTDLSNETGDQFTGEWSPGGAKIAYATHVTAVLQIFTMNASDGSGKTQLTFGTRNTFKPVYTPDGSHIVYSRSTMDGTGSALFWMKKSGSSQKRLTPDKSYQDDAFEYD